MISVATDQLDDSRRWHALFHRRQEVLTVQAVEFFRSNGIEPIVIKGVAAARYYPENAHRVSVDVDLAVGERDFDQAERILRNNTVGIPIDLHRELRHLDTAAWSDVFANSVMLTLKDGDVRVLRPEDDLRVLVVHWLIDGGLNKERLWDIFYLIDRRPPDFDWNRCLGDLSPNRRRWVDCAAGITSKYLGLDLSDTPFAGAAERLPDWMVRTLEKEWSAEIKHIPLEATIGDPRMLFHQMLKRIRPNPIQATIDCEGSFDAGTRVFYRVRNLMNRIVPSYRRVMPTIRSRIR